MPVSRSELSETVLSSVEVVKRDRDLRHQQCDTMKKARAFPDQHGISFTFHDFSVDGIANDQLLA